MKSGKSIFKLSRSQWISVAVLASSLGLAVAVTVPNSFIAGTPASATQVNDNFTALVTAVTAAEAALTTANAQIATLNSKLPLLWASSDTGTLGVNVVAGGRTTVNSLSITAPSDGFLVISGHVFVNGGELLRDFSSNLLVDGAGYSGHASQGFMTSVEGGAADLFSLSFTVTVPITAGAHTIDQDVGPVGGTANYFYNRNHLTATFFPSSQATFTPVQAGLSTQAGSSDPNGR
jgi:hypothetical protein